MINKTTMKRRFLFILLLVVAFNFSQPCLAADKSLVLLPLVIHSDPSKDYLRRALKGMLVSRLSGKGLQIIGDDKLYPLLKEREKEGIDSRDKAEELGRALKADFVVFGSLTGIGRAYSLDLYVLDSGKEPPKETRIFEAVLEDQLIPKLSDMAYDIRTVIAGVDIRPRKMEAEAEPKEKSVRGLSYPPGAEEKELKPSREKRKLVRPAGIPAVEKEKPLSVVDEKQEAQQMTPQATPQQAQEQAPEKQKQTLREVGSEKKPLEMREEPEEGGEPRDHEYVVRDGDSLSTVASRMEGYKDPLKWIILFRYNLEALGRWPEGPDFADRTLPQGMKLKIMMPTEPGASGKEGQGLWVANLMSDRNNEEIVPLAVRLARRGYPVYLTRTQVRGQEWMRLRVGFFAGKAEAQEVGKKIEEAVQVEAPWILKVGKEEYGEFAGFPESESDSRRKNKSF